MAAAKGTRPPNAGKGRKAGVPNKVTTALKDAIVQAGRVAGEANRKELIAVLGEDAVAPLDGLTVYCAHLALSAPQVFGPLIGKVLPLKVDGEAGIKLVVTWQQPNN
jgi:hypothetical protein